jgi:hypothetical protein
MVRVDALALAATSGLSILSRGVTTTFGASFGCTTLPLESWLLSHTYTTIRDKCYVNDVPARIFQSTSSTFISRPKFATGLLGIVDDDGEVV